MISVVLARLGVKVIILDDRSSQTAVGRADGLQPKTIETLQMLRLADKLLSCGVRVYDICLWSGSKTSALQRVGCEIHYPSADVDVIHPFILLCHQGMVEDVLIQDLERSGIEVWRNHTFEQCRPCDAETAPEMLQIQCAVSGEGQASYVSSYLVGCDGAKSKVRDGIADSRSEDTPHGSVWGVLDGELDTDFPDIWSKTLVTKEFGSVLIIPRERNMTRFYIEAKEASSARILSKELIMDQARRVLAPYRLEWLSVEWFGNYRVSQRVAGRFCDDELRTFIAGDAGHTHSPKAAQGMNTSMHDSWNLGWKLNLAVRGLALRHVLLFSYEDERKKIAHDLIDFDVDHANEIAAGDAQRLAQNFRTHTRFIAGVGVEYGRNKLNDGESDGGLRAGCNLLPARATRRIDANPVHVQLDVPMLGQFRIYFVVPDIRREQAKSFLSAVDSHVTSPSSFLSRISAAARTSYVSKPRPTHHEHRYVRPERYTQVSELFSFCLISKSRCFPLQAIRQALKS